MRCPWVICDRSIPILASKIDPTADSTFFQTLLRIVNFVFAQLLVADEEKERTPTLDQVRALLFCSVAAFIEDSFFLGGGLLELRSRRSWKKHPDVAGYIRERDRTFSEAGRLFSKWGWGKDLQEEPMGSSRGRQGRAMLSSRRPRLCLHPLKALKQLKSLLHFRPDHYPFFLPFEQGKKHHLPTPPCYKSGKNTRYKF